MNEISVTKARSPHGQSVWILRYGGDGDPIAALDDYESGLLPAGYSRLECDPHMANVRVYIVEEQAGEVEEPVRDRTVSMELVTPLATLKSSDLKVSEHELETIISLSRGYHQGGPFEMWTDGGFVVVPPEVTKMSILTINIRNDEDEVQEI
jgi:hypothetical protein